MNSPVIKTSPVYFCLLCLKVRTHKLEVSNLQYFESHLLVSNDTEAETLSLCRGLSQNHVF